MTVSSLHEEKIYGKFMCTNHALPNAAFITFIGTPRLKGCETVSRFSKIVNSYTMQ